MNKAQDNNQLDSYPNRSFNKLSKKQRRRKNKARCRRMKKQRNMQSKQETGCTDSRSNFETHPSTYSMFWDNYKKALDWQNKHKVAYWKSYALALQHENKVLHDFIHSLCVKNVNLNIPCPVETTVEPNIQRGFNSKQTHQSLLSKISTSNLEDEDEDENEFQEEESEVEVSKEMLDFFEQSLKHKLEREKMILSDEKDRDPEAPREQVGLKRKQEMKMLYGEDSAMILAMETALQLSYDKFCDTKSSSYWPNIPFNL